jgi:hypothetical protein
MDCSTLNEHEMIIILTGEDDDTTRFDSWQYMNYIDSRIIFVCCVNTKHSSCNVGWIGWEKQWQAPLFQ